MMVPTIHMNGDSRETLLGQCRKANDALWDAINALQEMAPNGRNYYWQGTDALGKAVAEHRERMNGLYAVKKEIENMMEAIADA
jgi:hypothetical protein